MKVVIELETAEERAMMGMSDKGRFVKARSTAIFLRQEWVPIMSEFKGVVRGYREALYIEVGLDGLEPVEIPLIPQLPT